MISNVFNADVKKSNVQSSWHSAFREQFGVETQCVQYSILFHIINAYNNKCFVYSKCQSSDYCDGLVKELTLYSAVSFPAKRYKV